MRNYGLFNMAIIDEIQEKKKRLEKSASEKDQVFFRYLNGEKIIIPDTEGIPDILKVCYSAFSESNSQTDLVKEVQRTQPVREGFHYSNNLVELIAVAKHDFEKEESNLQKYIDSHNAKEAYLINKIFPEIKCKTPLKIDTTIDQLVNDILVKNNLTDGEEKILRALKDANDLLDMYVIEEALKVCYQLHPSTKDKEDVKYLLSFYLRLHKLLHTVFSVIFYLLLVITLVYGTYRLAPYVASNWAILEPYLFVIQFITPIITTIILAGLQWKLNIFERIKPTQEKIVYMIESLVFKILGVDLSKIVKIYHSVSNHI